MLRYLAEPRLKNTGLRYWTHDQEVVGSNPAAYWMYISDKAR